MAEPPPAAVRSGFGAVGEPRLLPGGQARTWRVGELVLKPASDDDVQHWLSQLYDGWPAGTGVRVPTPVRAADGAWTYAGWAAHRWLPGETLHPADDPSAFRRVWQDLHDAVADVPRPALLDRRDDAWTYGDRVAWGEAPPVGSPGTLRLLETALMARRPVGGTSQVVHGDLTGNVLVATGLEPAVIDWPPYWRPPGFALAVVATDAVCWESAPVAMLELGSDLPDWDQLLLRAVVFRLATRGRLEVEGADRVGSDGYVSEEGRIVDLVLRRTR